MIENIQIIHKPVGGGVERIPPEGNKFNLCNKKNMISIIPNHQEGIPYTIMVNMEVDWSSNPPGFWAFLIPKKIPIKIFKKG